MSKYVWVVRNESLEATDSVHSTLKGAEEYLAEDGKYVVKSRVTQGVFHFFQAGTRAERIHASNQNHYYSVSKYLVRRRT